MVTSNFDSKKRLEKCSLNSVHWTLFGWKAWTNHITTLRITIRSVGQTLAEPHDHRNWTDRLTRERELRNRNQNLNITNAFVLERESLGTERLNLVQLVLAFSSTLEVKIASPKPKLEFTALSFVLLQISSTLSYELWTMNYVCVTPKELQRNFKGTAMWTSIINITLIAAHTLFCR